MASGVEPRLTRPPPLGAAREVHYAEVLAGRMDMEVFRRTQLADAVAPWGRFQTRRSPFASESARPNLERRRLVAGARELIDRLRAGGLRVGLLTNGPSALQQRKLAVTGPDRLLDAVAISQEIGVAKPEADAYRRAAELLGWQSRETAMVGDRFEWDVEGALRPATHSQSSLEAHQSPCPAELFK